MRKLRALLTQLPIPPVGPEPIRGNVPLAAAYLKLYAQRHGAAEHCEIHILPATDANRLGDRALVDAVCAREPDLLGLSCYLWNVDRSLWLARRVKERLPGCAIVVGGPEITTDNAWVLAEPAVDFAVFGEGERTFAELLAWRTSGAERAGLSRIAGLGWRDGRELRQNLPRTPMADLAAISSPYVEGILDAGEPEQLLLETVRGCVFRCKFCYYPKAYDSQHYLPDEHVLADLAHARARGAHEVFLLDPTLNQRPRFGEFVELLARGNPDGRLQLHGELRGEGLDAKLARRMRAAGFVEVELGLQSVDDTTQALMDRRNNLKAFERGARALREAGIRVKADLIVGLPGDTPESVRRGMRFLADGGLCDMAQVFRLGILPGTAFRRDAEHLGITFDPRPPYFVESTPTLSGDDIDALLAEAEDVFDCTFDPTPPPWLPAADDTGCTPVTCVAFDLDREPAALAQWRPPACAAHVFTLRFHAAEPFEHLPGMVAAVRALLADDPFTLLHVAIETGDEFPLDVIDALRAAAVRTERVYLERWLREPPGAATRLSVVLPATAMHTIDADWTDALLELADLVWCDAPATGAALAGLAAGARAGEWHGRAVGAAAARRGGVPH
ncbi:MAG: B12-binding domain-containing radical SAM protein [Planctomycetes bacterium]|nr:B12-binding domain-containing radical SAM protein [Planctomycetota bacterium]